MKYINGAIDAALMAGFAVVFLGTLAVVWTCGGREARRELRAEFGEDAEGVL